MDAIATSSVVGKYLLEEEVAFEAEVDDSLVEVEVEVITIRTISPVL